MRWIRRGALLGAIFCLGLLLLAGGARLLLYWAQPDPRVLSFTPMTFDTASREAIGILLNGSGQSGTVVLLTVNSETGEQSTQTIAYTTAPMQAVPYSTPAFRESKALRTTLLFARSMTPEHPGTHVSAPSN